MTASSLTLAGQVPVLKSNTNMQYIAPIANVMLDMGFEEALIEPPLEDGNWRRCFVTERFCADFGDAVQKLTISDPESLIPEQQIWAKIRIFLNGAKMVYPQDMRNLRPVGKGVWELKTNDVRLFGWFPCKDCFVIHDMADANILHDEQDVDLWASYVDRLSAFLDQITQSYAQLSPLLGSRTENVLSNRPQ